MDMRRWICLLGLIPLLLAAEASEPSAEPKSAELAKQALELEARAAALRALEEDLNRKIDKLEELRKVAADVIEPGETAREEQLQTLIRFYQAMKPQSAARLLEKLPVQLAADVIGSMKSRGAGKILNVMKPEQAVRISKLMAGQK
jgi:flagellar motility protein MotE (MotC chaperone)